MALVRYDSSPNPFKVGDKIQWIANYVMFNEPGSELNVGEVVTVRGLDRNEYGPLVILSERPGHFKYAAKYFIPVTEVQPAQCQHVYRTYGGFTDTYDYCEKCDAKRVSAAGPHRDLGRG